MLAGVLRGSQNPKSFWDQLIDPGLGHGLARLREDGPEVLDMDNTDWLGRRGRWRHRCVIFYECSLSMGVDVGILCF